jgi:hypothetical protein
MCYVKEYNGCVGCFGVGRSGSHGFCCRNLSADAGFFACPFTVGVQSETVTFDQPTLNNKVQVQVSGENGVALWNAKLLNGEAVIWEHSKGQGEQTTYTSEWMELTSGTYNFTFGTIGAGSLQATVTVSSKGGFW